MGCTVGGAVVAVAVVVVAVAVAGAGLSVGVPVGSSTEAVVCSCAAGSVDPSVLDCAQADPKSTQRANAALSRRRQVVPLRVEPSMDVLTEPASGQGQRVRIDRMRSPAGGFFGVFICCL